MTFVYAKSVYLQLKEKKLSALCVCKAGVA